jgi:hypothetical protein
MNKKPAAGQCGKKRTHQEQSFAALEKLPHGLSSHLDRLN